MMQKMIVEMDQVICDNHMQIYVPQCEVSL